MAISTNLGYPRIGRNRELKKATESYWSGKIQQTELDAIAKDLRAQAWRTQADAGIQLIPSNDFSYYDHVLDTIAMTGAVPQSYGWDGGQVDIDTYFAMARGSVQRDLPALEMTKWFNSNYHYIVPEFWSGMNFSLASSKPFDEFAEAKGLGYSTKPVLVGPVTFLLLGKAREGDLNPLDLMDELLPVYQKVLEKFQDLGATWVQFDEPAFVSDRSDEEREALTHAYEVLAASRGSVNISVQTYFDRVGESYDTLASLPVQALGLDFVHGREGNLRSIGEKGFPEDKTLVAGVVDGRNIWINDLNHSVNTIESLPVDSHRLMVGPSSSLIFVPIDVRVEDQLDHELREWLAFADQKLAEIATVTDVMNKGREETRPELNVNAELLQKRSASEAIHHSAVKERAASVTEGDASRGAPFEQRREEQRLRLKLPCIPQRRLGHSRKRRKSVELGARP